MRIGKKKRVIRREEREFPIRIPAPNWPVEKPVEVPNWPVREPVKVPNVRV